MESYTNKYVIGFAFHNDSVLLIEKLKPDWQRGRLNGVGGKIEPNELPLDAMQREFFEECGIITAHTQWEPYAQITIPTGPNRFDVAHCFTTRLNDIQLETFQANKTEETCRWYPVSDVISPNPKMMIANVATLISGAILKRLTPEVNLVLNYK